MGIADSSTFNTDQTAFLNAYNATNLSTESDALDTNYANFLRVLNDKITVHKSLILLNRYLNPVWFSSSSFNATTFSTFNTLLNNYITTSDTTLRTGYHYEIVKYLNNITAPNLFLTITRTSAYFLETKYSAAPEVSESYVSSFKSLPSVGATSLESLSMQ